MDRRDFLKGSLLATGVLSMSTVSCSHRGASKRASGKLHIQYIRENIPTFEVPPYKGQRYIDHVPDTHDMTERARLGVHALTSITDPEADNEIYGAADFFRNPAVISHDFNDWVENQEGFYEALPLLRTATGDSLNNQVDPVWMSRNLKEVGPDGLIYEPLYGRPWSRLNVNGMNPVWKADGTTTNYNDPSVRQAANVSTCQRIISVMTIYYLRDKNPMWKATIEKMIRCLSDLAINRDDYCYFVGGSYEPNVKIDPNAKMPLGSLWGVSWNARLIQGLAQYYRVSGYEPANELARKLTKYTRFHGQVFEPNGPWLLSPEFTGTDPYPEDTGVPDFVKKFAKGSKLGGHGHGHGIALLSILEYATAVKDNELLEFCQASFEWARNPGPEYGVSTLVGWFPEFYVPHYPSADADPQGDMIGVGIKLTTAGLGDYWDDIDRWVRNQFAEQQLTSAEWVDKLVGRSPHKPVAWNETADHAVERNLGAFGSSVSGNDWALGFAANGIAQCCTGTCTRSIYYVWEHIVEWQGNQLRVNMLLNRASRWADVYSYIPYEGRVDLKMKEECKEVLVRAPEWVKGGSPEIQCRVNGAHRRLRWESRYVNVGVAKPGDKVTITFPISERTVKERIGPVTYTLVIKGNTVVSIDPAGKNVPLYQDRGKYRQDKVQWRQAERFVPDEEIYW